ncbi:hypothetical protein [Schleiferilactobacillus harbinensis]|uniref:hypothetical protein n=1 Tax=Schleiferilactobacillus harbinensis TaxID=304207 RepID=UPI00345EA628
MKQRRNGFLMAEALTALFVLTAVVVLYMVTTTQVNRQLSQAQQEAALNAALLSALRRPDRPIVTLHQGQQVFHAQVSTDAVIGHSAVFQGQWSW